MVRRQQGRFEHSRQRQEKCLGAWGVDRVSEHGYYGGILADLHEAARITQLKDPRPQRVGRHCVLPEVTGECELGIKVSRAGYPGGLRHNQRTLTEKEALEDAGCIHSQPERPPVRPWKI